MTEREAGLSVPSTLSSSSDLPGSTTSGNAHWAVPLARPRAALLSQLGQGRGRLAGFRGKSSTERSAAPNPGELTLPGGSR